MNEMNEMQIQELLDKKRRRALIDELCPGSNGAEDFIAAVEWFEHGCARLTLMRYLQNGFVLFITITRETERLISGEMMITASYSVEVMEPHPSYATVQRDRRIRTWVDAEGVASEFASLYGGWKRND